jgi:hypothetical protein
MKADWELWGSVLSAEVWQAVALSLDLDPEGLDIDWRPADYSDPFESCPVEFKRRLKIAINHAQNGRLELASIAFSNGPRSSVKLPIFTKWAQSLDWPLPPRPPFKMSGGTNAGGTSGSEAKCKTWLIDLMKAGPSTKTQAEYRKEAESKFEPLGTRAFLRAWGGGCSRGGRLQLEKTRPKTRWGGEKIRPARRYG